MALCFAVFVSNFQYLLKHKDLKKSAEKAHGPLRGGSVLHGNDGISDLEGEAEKLIQLLSSLVKLAPPASLFLLGLAGATPQQADGGLDLPGVFRSGVKGDKKLSKLPSQP